MILFCLFIASGTFLSYSGKVEPQLVLVPIVTGFLGLLASIPKPPPQGDTVSILRSMIGPRRSDFPKTAAHTEEPKKGG
jgi:hypothetical protein